MRNFTIIENSIHSEISVEICNQVFLKVKKKEMTELLQWIYGCLVHINFYFKTTEHLYFSVLSFFLPHRSLAVWLHVSQSVCRFLAEKMCCILINDESLQRFEIAQ